MSYLVKNVGKLYVAGDGIFLMGCKLTDEVRLWEFYFCECYRSFRISCCCNWLKKIVHFPLPFPNNWLRFKKNWLLFKKNWLLFFFFLNKNWMFFHYKNGQLSFSKIIYLRLEFIPCWPTFFKKNRCTFLSEQLIIFFAKFA